VGETADDAVEVRVRYPEVDRMGVAHHTAHLVWFEIGRTELMRARGVAYAGLEADGIFLPVIAITCAYHAPARYDDLLVVRAEVTEPGPVRIGFAYRIERASDRRLIATGSTRHAAVDRAGHPRRLPPAVRDRLR
jgi:acyl-CoA thioester hydrolase